MISIDQLMVNIRDVGGVLKASAAHAQGVTLQDAAKAAATAAKAVVMDQPWVTDAERNRRWTICLSCPLLTANHQCDKRRGGCNCYVPGKIRFKAESCPQGKWTALV